MKNAIILYSSQNGSTKKAALSLAGSLTGHKLKVDVLNISQKNDVNLQEYDLIGLGCPVYVSRPSLEMMMFLDTVNSLAGKKVFTFVTYGSDIGDGANFLRRKVKEKGGIDLGAFSCPGRNLFPGYTKKGYLFSPDSPDENDLKKTGAFVESILKAEGEKGTAFDRAPHVILRFERFVLNSFLIRHLYSYFFKAATSCTGCNTCIKKCPTGNISKGKKAKPQWGRNCILCAKCEIACPRGSVQTPFSWFIFKPFYVFNIKWAHKNMVPVKKVVPGKKGI